MLLMSMLLFSFSCSKEPSIEKPIEEEFVQHFDAIIAGKAISIENTHENKTILHGQRSTIGNDDNRRDLYNVNVDIPDVFNSNLQPFLRFQVDGIKKGTFDITGEYDKYDYLGSNIVLFFKNSNTVDSEVLFYVVNTTKKPFEVQITKYDFPEGSVIPIVAGKLNGVLYNENDIRDSIVIKDGSFEVRF